MTRRTHINESLLTLKPRLLKDICIRRSMHSLSWIDWMVQKRISILEALYLRDHITWPACSAMVFVPVMQSTFRLRDPTAWSSVSGSPRWNIIHKKERIRLTWRCFASRVRSTWAWWMFSRKIRRKLPVRGGILFAITAYLIWTDNCECSCKTQTSKLVCLLNFKRVKRDVRALSFELWKSFRKCHFKWDRLYRSHAQT